MTRFAIDAPTAIQIAQEAIIPRDGHHLVAPSVLRSHVMSKLYREVRQGSRSAEMAHTILNAITTMHIRLLGDRVSRAVAWQIAEQLDWDDTANAEYVSVAKLQADVFITLDESLARQVDNIVVVGEFNQLREACEARHLS